MFFLLCWPLGNVSILELTSSNCNTNEQIVPSKPRKKYRFKFNMQSNHEVIRDQLHKWKILWTREKKQQKRQQHISCNYRKLINGIVKLVKLSLSQDSSWTLKLHAKKERKSSPRRKRGCKKFNSTWYRSGIHKLCLKAFQVAFENCEVHN